MQVLVQFVHRHFDFRMPELDSLLQMHGLEPTQLYNRCGIAGCTDYVGCMSWCVITCVVGVGNSEDVDLESPFLLLRCPEGMHEAQFVERVM